MKKYTALDRSATLLQVMGIITFGGSILVSFAFEDVSFVFIGFITSLWMLAIGGACLALIDIAVAVRVNAKVLLDMSEAQTAKKSKLKPSKIQRIAPKAAGE